LAEWRERFNLAWPTLAEDKFDDRFKRMWELYLAYCEGGFRAGMIDVKQMLLMHR
jgi:cyclopropane-fatty-acyl-phospholipid synthase